MESGWGDMVFVVQRRGGCDPGAVYCGVTKVCSMFEVGRLERKFFFFFFFFFVHFL